MKQNWNFLGKGGAKQKPHTFPSTNLILFMQAISNTVILAVLVVGIGQTRSLLTIKFSVTL